MTTLSSERKRSGVGGFVLWAVPVFVTAALGGWASASAASFYAELVQPNWAPPGWLFGPVWTCLYALMAVAAWLVWRAHGWQAARLPLLLFCAQLVFNALWSWLFFSWHMGGAALLDIALLLVLIGATIVTFWPLHRWAAMLLMPYFLWVAFASVLNYSMWSLNPERLAFGARVDLAAELPLARINAKCCTSEFRWTFEDVAVFVGDSR